MRYYKYKLTIDKMIIIKTNRKYLVIVFSYFNFPNVVL